MTYGDKLKDPRWQRKRLEILNLHGWVCDTCCSQHRQDIPVQVHHKFYKISSVQGRLEKADPWDYDDDDFRVLCEPCHEQTEIALMEVRKAIGGFEHFELAKLADEIFKAAAVANPKAVLDMLFWQLGQIQEDAAGKASRNHTFPHEDVAS